MKPAALDHLVLEVSDVERSLEFYVSVLGLESERVDQYRLGKAPFVSVRAGQSLIDLFPRSEGPVAGPPHFCLTYDVPMAEIQETLIHHGIKFSDPGLRFGARGMGDSVYVTDPDGHTIELRTYQT